MGQEETEEKQLEEDSVVFRVLKTLNEGKAAFAEIYDRAENDMEFASGLDGAQYGEKERMLRGEGRVKQQFSILNQYIERVMGLYDAAPYGVKISPLTDDATDMANAAQGLVDAIQSESGAKTAYRTALRNSSTCGYGWIAVSTKWANDTDKTADVVVSVEAIHDPFSVYIDPASTEVDGSDAEWASFCERLSPAKAKAMYGDDVLLAGVGSSDDATVDEGSGRTVEAVTFYEKSKKTTEIQLKGGLTKRVREKAVEMYRIVNGHLVERRSLALSRVPIVPVYGLPVRKDGKDSFVGLVHRAKDAQRNLNYAVSTGAERLALSPTMKLIAAEEAVSGNEEEFANANRSNATLLKYQAFTQDGKALPKPEKVDPAINNSDIASMYQMYSAALSDVIGIPQDGIGSAVGREQTAEETLMRAKAAETVLSTLYTNLASSVSAIGRVIVELIAVSYVGKRQFLTKEDGGVRREMGDFDTVPLTPEDLSVDIDAGPLLGTQRKENLRSMIALLQISPEIFKPLIFAQACKYVDGVEKTFVSQIEKLTLFSVQQSVQGAQNSEALAQENQQLKQLLAQAQQSLMAAKASSADSQMKMRADLLKTQMQNQNRLELEAMKQRGESSRMVLDVQTEAEKDVNRAQVEFEKAEAERAAQTEDALALGQDLADAGMVYTRKSAARGVE